MADVMHMAYGEINVAKFSYLTTNKQNDVHPVVTRIMKIVNSKAKNYNLKVFFFHVISQFGANSVRAIFRGRPP